MSRWERNCSYQSSTFKKPSLHGKTERNLVNISSAQKISSVFCLLFPGVKTFYEDILITTKLHHSSAREINSFSLVSLPLFSRSVAKSRDPAKQRFQLWDRLVIGSAQSGSIFLAEEFKIERILYWTRIKKNYNILHEVNFYS